MCRVGKSESNRYLIGIPATISGLRPPLGGTGRSHSVVMYRSLGMRCLVNIQTQTSQKSGKAPGWLKSAKNILIKFIKELAKIARAGRHTHLFFNSL